MTIPFSASKTRVRSYLSALNEGRPLEPAGAWSQLDMLCLAGVLHAAMNTHPPAWAGGQAVVEGDDEKREAVELTHEQELIEATRFLASITMLLLDDRDHELPVDGDLVRGVLALGADDQPVVQLHTGGAR